MLKINKKQQINKQTKNYVDSHDDFYGFIVCEGENIKEIFNNIFITFFH